MTFSITHSHLVGRARLAHLADKLNLVASQCYGLEYGLLEELRKPGVPMVFRIRNKPCMETVKAIALTEAGDGSHLDVSDGRCRTGRGHRLAEPGKKRLVKPTGQSSARVAHGPCHALMPQTAQAATPNRLHDGFNHPKPEKTHPPRTSRKLTC